MQSKGFDIFLCGDWNINFKEHSQCLLELQNLLLMHNLTNTVNSPTRITANISTQIDVMITGLYCNVQTVNYDLGYSDHFAQLSPLMVDTSVIDPKFTMKRQFSENAINEFLNYLQTEPWDHILAMDDVNDSFNTFMNTFLYYFNVTFPLKTLPLNKNNNKWIIKGLLVSKNKLQILRGLKRKKQLSTNLKITLKPTNSFTNIY